MKAIASVFLSTLMCASAVHAEFVDVAPGTPLADAGECWTAQWGDYDNDGDLDLHLAKPGAANRLFRNDGDNEWPDVALGPMADVGPSRGGSWGDVDNDGDLDLCLANFNGTSRLFRNDGDAVFVNIAFGTPIHVLGRNQTANWVDYNNDGRLDMHIVRHQNPSSLLRNDGANQWFDVIEGLPMGSELGALGSEWADYDNDGDMDVFITNGSDADALYRNDGADHFENVAPGTPLADEGLSSLFNWLDYDNDGDLDLYLQRGYFEPDPNSLYRNDGNNQWVDVAPGTILEGTGRCYSASVADYDNDGDLDIHVCSQPNYLCRNDGNDNWVDEMHLMPHDIGSGAWGDFDNDGDLDLYGIMGESSSNCLYRNDLDNGNHWLQVELRGDRSNRDQPFTNWSAIGARVRVVAGGVSQIREVRTGNWNQGSLTLEFGLGAATAVDLIEVRWTTGVEQQVVSPSFLDERIVWVEGHEPGPWTWPAGLRAGHQSPLGIRLHANRPNPFNPSTEFDYELPVATQVRLRIFDVNGCSVRVLQDGVLGTAGLHTARWDGRNDRGDAMASGVYYYRIEAGSWTETRPMVLVR